MNMNEFGERRQGLAESLHIDLPLFMGIIALLTTSLFILYSASGQDMTMAEDDRLGFSCVSFIKLIVQVYKSV